MDGVISFSVTEELNASQMNNTQSYANSNNFTSSPANDFFFTKHSLLFFLPLPLHLLLKGGGVLKSS